MEFDYSYTLAFHTNMNQEKFIKILRAETKFSQNDLRRIDSSLVHHRHLRNHIYIMTVVI